MEVEYIIKLEEKEIKALKTLNNMNCTGLSCIKCPWYMENYDHCIVFYATRTYEQLQERKCI